MTSTPRQLSKSRFLAGRHCPKRLWLSRHAPERATPPSPNELVIRATGESVGRLAHQLFPGGVLVAEGPEEHARAVARTQTLLCEATVPAIFEGAFEFGGVRIRADVLERIGEKSWGLREVKSAARLKDPYLEDIAIQKYVLDGCGIDVRSAELIHVNTGFERGTESFDWRDFFTRVEVTETVERMQPAIAEQVAELIDCVTGAEPEIEPAIHCRGRRLCEFWEHCTRDKGADWILRLPRITRKQFETLRDSGVERIGDIPGDFALQAAQRHVREVVRTGQEWVCHGLAEALRGSGPPTAYLDFEIASPAVPLYAGTRPFQPLPFQWSLHRLDARGTLTHRSFLADGGRDPRRDFAERLIAELQGGSEPILVYSAFESRTLEILALAFEDLWEPLHEIRERLVDLLPVVRGCVYHRAFGGSFSIKNVAPALAPGFGYADLAGVTEGGAAADAFVRMASGVVSEDDAAGLREQLLAYCERDTLALVEVHRSLHRLASGR